VQWGLNAKTQFIYSISYFNLGGLEFVWRAKPTKAPRGDKTEHNAATSVVSSTILAQHGLCLTSETLRSLKCSEMIKIN